MLEYFIMRKKVINFAMFIDTFLEGPQKLKHKFSVVSEKNFIFIAQLKN